MFLNYDIISFMIYECVSSLYKDLVVNVINEFNKSKNIIYASRNTLKVVLYKEDFLVIKSFKIPNFLRSLEYLLYKPYKAKKSYYNSIYILSLGLDIVAKPIGYYLDKRSFLLNKSYFLSLKLDYDYELRYVFTNSEFTNRVAILKNFAKFTANLHSNGIRHNDYSPGNVLIKDNGNEYKFYIVDINRVTFTDLNYKDRVASFTKFSASDSDLDIISKVYASICNLDLNKFSTDVLRGDKSRKTFLNRRRYIKKLLINK